MALGTHCGTSWEGRKWVWRGGRLGHFSWGVDARVGSMLLALAAPAIAVLTALLLSVPASAHGTSCASEASKPFPSEGDIKAKSVARCAEGGYIHVARTEIWKNINDWPDAHVASREASFKDRGGYLYARGNPRGCGIYYSIGKVKYHHQDRSNRDYIRC